MYADVHELAAEHITVIYDKLDGLERKIELEFAGVRSEQKRHNIDIAELKLAGRNTNNKLAEIDAKLDLVLQKLDMLNG